MPAPTYRFSPGLPRYDGLGDAMSALTVSGSTRQLAQEADAWLLPDGWGPDYLPAPNIETSLQPSHQPAGPAPWRP